MEVEPRLRIGILPDEEDGEGALAEGTSVESGTVVETERIVDVSRGAHKTCWIRTPETRREMGVRREEKIFFMVLEYPIECCWMKEV